MVAPRMGKALRGFQTQLARRMMGRLLLRTSDGRWIYTSAAAAREEALLLTMEEYIRRRQNTVAHYIATRSLLNLYEGSERAPGLQLGMQRWEQVVIDLEGEREVAAAMAEGGRG